MGNRSSSEWDDDDDLEATEKYDGLIKFLRFSMIVAFGATASIGSWGFYFGTNTKRGDSKIGSAGCAPSLMVPNPENKPPMGAEQLTTCQEVLENSTHGNFQITIVCISFYMVLFGIIGIMAECKANQAFQKFAFLASRFGRGLFLFFIGSFAACMGNQIYEQLTSPPDYKIFAVGITDLVIGCFSMCTYLCIKSGQAGEYHAKYDDLA